MYPNQARVDVAKVRMILVLVSLSRQYMEQQGGYATQGMGSRVNGQVGTYLIMYPTVRGLSYAISLQGFAAKSGEWKLWNPWMFFLN